MSNPSNLLRPSLLETRRQQEENAPSPSQPNPNPNPTPNTNVSEDLRRVIAEVSRSVFNEIVPQFLNVRNSNVDMPQIGIEQLNELEKVPDIVKSLREFSGNPSEFGSWKKSVDRILTIYNTIRETPKYFAILNTVRNKIIFEADSVLESYNTPLDWEAIKKCLTCHYADKRDIGTLENQMCVLYQGTQTFQQFYRSVYALLTIILNKVSCMEISEEGIQILTETYKRKALDTFIGGLSGDLPRLLGIREPEDLPQALYLCEKLENQSRRNNMITKPQMHPPGTNRNPNQRFLNQNQNDNNNFYPHLTYLPQIPQRKQIFQPRIQQPIQYSQQPIQYSQQPPRPPKPQPKPIPMEVDESIRTRAINYMNRPKNQEKYHGKRPISAQVQQQNKFQRNFYIDEETEQYEQEVQQTDDLNQETETLQEYVSNYAQEEQTEEQQCDEADINFLD